MGRRIEIQRPTATESIDERKEVAIVSIQGWPRSNGYEQEHDGEEEKDERGRGRGRGEREGSLEPKNSGDRVLTARRHRSKLILALAMMPTRSELNGTSSLPSASDRARRRLIRLFADTSINTTHSSRFSSTSHLTNYLHTVNTILSRVKWEMSINSAVVNANKITLLNLII